MQRALAIVAILGAMSSATVAAEDWPSFRGPRGNGESSELKLPLEWSPTSNIKWKVALPQPSNGSPIVSNGCVFVACAEDPQGLKRSLYCFDRRDGSQRWVRTGPAARRVPRGVRSCWPRDAVT